MLKNNSLNGVSRQARRSGEQTEAFDPYFV